MEEMLEEDLAKFREDGFFKRLKNMFRGFSQPRSSKEYKIAMIELQRLSAPLVAILVPSIVVVVLIVVSAVKVTPKQQREFVVSDAQDEVEELKEEEPEEITPPPVDEINVDVEVDTPEIGNPTDIANDIPTPNEPVSVKVNTVDSVLNTKSPVILKSAFADGRTSGTRGKFLTGGKYGDARTEAAVMKALRWLKKTQRADGAWNADPGKAANITAMTGFALLCYLAHGETPSSEEFGDTVKKAIDFLLKAYDRKAKKFSHSDGNEYTYPIAVYALSEAYGMTKYPDLKYIVEESVLRIIKSQSSTGAWDYKLNKNSTRDDMSYSGWCIQALKAAKMAGVHPDGLDACIKKAIKCFQTRLYDDKRGFVYTYSQRNTSPGMAGVGCLAMQLLGYAREPQVRHALRVMANWKPTFSKAEAKTFLPPGKDNSPQYYFYYATQCKYQAGMGGMATAEDKRNWGNWNKAMKSIYPSSIKNDGEIMGPKGKKVMTGYWQNQDQYTPYRTMGTCLAALQLMVYYRYLPTTSLKATQVEPDIKEAATATDDVKVVVDDL